MGVVDDATHSAARLINSPFEFLYRLLQSLLSYIFSPQPPPPNAHLGHPKIAVIGAGLTGVSSAAHCVGHGFEVTIFEAGDRKSLGGIWAKVNNTSGKCEMSSVLRGLI
jgi:NADPH-dependent 2,4-dienoyl-CoA reductase/sulfur reductase-like enzyme